MVRNSFLEAEHSTLSPYTFYIYIEQSSSVCFYTQRSLFLNFESSKTKNVIGKACLKTRHERVRNSVRKKNHAKRGKMRS